jgi:hypothetical protein
MYYVAITDPEYAGSRKIAIGETKQIATDEIAARLKIGPEWGSTSIHDYRPLVGLRLWAIIDQCD